MSRNRPTTDGPTKARSFDLPLVRQDGEQAAFDGKTRGWHCPYLDEVPRKMWQEGWDSVPEDVRELACINRIASL